MGMQALCKKDGRKDILSNCSSYSTFSVPLMFKNGIHFVSGPVFLCIWGFVIHLVHVALYHVRTVLFIFVDHVIHILFTHKTLLV